MIRAACILGAVLIMIGGVACAPVAGDGAPTPASLDGVDGGDEGPPVRMRDIGPGERPPPDSDEAGLWLLMDSLEEKLKTAGNRVRDKALNDYVKDIVCKLAGPRCGDIRPYIMRMPAFNATMGPNGVMVVWTGALVRTRNEAQLAAVLGHEIGHYLRRHSLQRMRDVTDKAGLLNLLSVGTVFVGVPLAGDLAYLAVLGAIFSFSRDNEREADDIGVRLMAEAGYDPREAAKVWQQLIAEEKADKDAERPSIFFATHPPPKERMKTLIGHGKRLAAEGRPGKVGASRYRAVIGPYLYTYLRDELRHRRFARAEVVLARLIGDHEPAGLIHYYQGELYRIRGQKGDREKALAAYGRALDAGGAPVEIHRSLGLMHRRAGAAEKSRRAVAKYLRLAPGAGDRRMIRALMKQGG